MEFKLGNRTIGEDHRPLVVPEVGINHEGQVDKALQMVEAAASCGAEILKFQCHITEKEMVPTDMTPGEISSERLWDIIKRCELNEAEERRVQRATAERGMIYLSTPFSREAADRLEEAGVLGFKIGSGECNNYPLIEHIAAKRLPMIVSTGMNDLRSIRKTVDIIRGQGTPSALMHCTSMYPTPYENVRLGAITELREAFPGTPIGLSDHSLNIWTCLGAVALGACILEKHFTVTRNWPGPDVPISIEPQELRDLIGGADAIWRARGGNKSILAEEKPVIDFAYATVVSLRRIAKGETFTRENVWVKRPGTGQLKAERFNEVLGRRAAKDVPADAHIDLEAVEGLGCQ